MCTLLVTVSRIRLSTSLFFFHRFSHLQLLCKHKSKSGNPSLSSIGCSSSFRHPFDQQFIRYRRFSIELANMYPQQNYQFPYALSMRMCDILDNVFHLTFGPIFGFFPLFDNSTVHNISQDSLSFEPDYMGFLIPRHTLHLLACNIYTIFAPYSFH